MKKWYENWYLDNRYHDFVPEQDSHYRDIKVHNVITPYDLELSHSRWKESKTKRKRNKNYELV